MSLHLSGIRLGLYTDEEIRKISAVRVTSATTYERGLPKDNGVNDPRMGVSEKTRLCPTCGLAGSCNNHYGHIELAKPILRIGQVNSILFILRSVCWACSRPRFTNSFNEECCNAVNIASIKIQGKERLRSISEACKNKLVCPWKDCLAPQPVYTKINKLFFGRTFKEKSAALFECEEERAFATKRLMPDEIRSILKHIPDTSYTEMGLNPTFSHPKHFVMSAHIVPPPSIRPATSISSTEAKIRGENDLTVAIQDIVKANIELETVLASGDEEKIHVAWDKLQIFCGAIIKQGIKKLPTYNGTLVIHARAMGKRQPKVIKDRITGKKGRLRGNLSGKRVDHAGRSVVGPDVSHDIFQLGVPSSIMRTLTFPESVNRYTIDKLRSAVRLGANNSNGALTVRIPTLNEEVVKHLSLMDTEARAELAANLKHNWIVERHLRNGDWVLFNRQPSLHKGSIQAFMAYEVPSLQFKLPLPCTKPFNADFDGDEMNIHSLQGYEAIAEAQEIMAVPHQIVTPQSNSVSIGLVQDSLVGAYLMTSNDVFITKEEFFQLSMSIHYNPKSQSYPDIPSYQSPDFIDIPPPAVLHSPKGPLWTGKQLFSLLLHPNISMTKTSEENSVIIQNGILLNGRLCKQTLGATTNGIIHEVWKTCGSWAASKFISDTQRLMMQWLTRDTVCISVMDCVQAAESSNTIQEEVRSAIHQCDSIASADVPQEVKEVKQTQIMRDVLRKSGSIVMESMNKKSGICTVIAAGAKGNLMNISQIAGLVGQQTIRGLRVPQREGPLGARTLACFPPGENSPMSRGFVASSYLQGLQPSEFFFHQQAGREGVVATAVQTADTGYNHRRMVKNQESEVIMYDMSVRVSSNIIVQMRYNGDDYDGSFVERMKLPCVLSETFKGSECEVYSWKFLRAIKLQKSIYSGDITDDFSLPLNLTTLIQKCRRSGEPILNSFTILLQTCLQHVLRAHGQAVPTTVSVLSLLDIPETSEVDDCSKVARCVYVLQCKDLEDLSLEDIQSISEKFSTIYYRGLVHPGEGVGAVGSSCIGEPSTQMTLNIFHYSGIAEKNVTLTGLPRFKQIINAIDNYDSANMKIVLYDKADIYSMKKLSAQLCELSLMHVIKRSWVEHTEADSDVIPLKQLQSQCMKSLQLNSFPTTKTVAGRLSSSTRVKSDRFNDFCIVIELEKHKVMEKYTTLEEVGISIKSFLGDDAHVLWNAQWCKRWFVIVRTPSFVAQDCDEISARAVHDSMMESAVLRGVEGVSKCIPNADNLTTDGSDLCKLSKSSEVNILQTTTNNIQEVCRVLGVEAAGCLQQAELHRVLSFDGSYVDPRHTWLLTDTITRSGAANPLNRHKMEEMGGSLLQCASFEQTLEVFENGAAFGKSDSLGGATEKLIVGQPVHVGTGSFAVLSTVEYEQAEGNYVLPMSSTAMEEEEVIEPLFMCFQPTSRKKISRYDITPIKPFFLHLQQSAFVDKIFKLSATLHPSVTQYESLHKAMCAYTGWKNAFPTSYSSVTQVFFLHESCMYRTDIVYSSDTVSSSIVKLQEQTDSYAGDGFTVESSLWQSVESSSLPLGVESTAVNIVHQKEFKKGCWKFILEKSWSGDSLYEVEKQQEKPGKLTVRVELDHPEELLENLGSTVDFMSHCLMLKIEAMMKTYT